MQINKAFLEKLTDVIADYVAANNDPETPVVNYQPGYKLEELASSIETDGIGDEQLLEEVKKYLHYSVRTTHPNYSNQLWSSINWPSFIGEIITALTNTSMATYEIAPLATLMERELVQKVNTLCGFRTDDNPAEGIMVTGGSNANLVAMLAARNQAVPGSKEGGLPHNKLVMFVSEKSHYSYGKDANIIGIGSDNVIKVKSDDKGRMLPDALEAAIEKAKADGQQPFFIGLTAGTTVYGAFDPIEAIAPIAEKHELWLHVDGAWGGAVILSDKHRHLVKGLEKADSFAWDMHKAMGIPIIASFVLFRKEGTLLENNSGGGSAYIFHKYDNQFYDTGRYSLQCGRRNDALKSWLAWRYYGDKGMEQRLNTMMDRAAYLADKVRQSDRAQLILEPEYLNVCFQILPADGEEDTGVFNAKLRSKMMEEGKYMVNISYTEEGGVYFRQIFANPEVTEQQVDDLFEYLLVLAYKLEKEKV